MKRFVLAGLKKRITALISQALLREMCYLEEARYCPDCWRVLLDDAKYCPVCGAMAKVVAFEPPKPEPVFRSVIPYLIISAGFLSLLGAFLNFGTLLGFVQFYVFGLDPRSSPVMPVMFLLMALLGFVGFVCGRAAGQANRWNRESRRSGTVQVAFVSFVGLLHLTEGLLVLGSTFWLGAFMALGIGVPVLIFSLIGLVLMSLA